MIETWYFCSSVQASPIVTQQFMTVIHILRSRRVAPELIQMALRELARAEPIMRRYALPEVVALGLRRDLERLELQRDLREMLTDALHVVDIDVRDALLSGWDALLRNAPPDEVLVSLRVAIDRAEYIRQPQPPEPAPYVHSEDFVAEIGLLSVCLGGARRDSHVAEALADNEAVGTLLRGSLANGFGRLALLLAAELASVLGEDIAGAGAPEASLLSLAHAEAPWEPDVLALLARLSFGFPGDATATRRPSEVQRQIVTEIATFSRLYRFFPQRRPRTPGARDVMGRLGLDSAPDEVTTLVLWQAVLWELAVQFDPKATAEAMATLWIAPHKDISGPIRSTIPVPTTGLHAWRRWAIALARLRSIGDAAPIDFAPRSGSLQLTTWGAVALISPWISRATAHSTGPEAFPRAADGLALLRMLSAAIIACDLLDHPSVEEHQPAVAFCLHVGNVQEESGHRHFIDALRRQQAPTEAPMSVPLSGLALFVDRAMRRIGLAVSDEVDPAWLADYLLVDSDGGFVPEQERWLRGPRALTAAGPWIDDVLSGSLPGDTSGVGRWLRPSPQGGRGHVERVLLAMTERFAGDKFHKPAALLRLHFGYSGKRASATSWHRSPRPWNNVGLWPVLSADELSFEQWISTRWPAKIRGNAARALATVWLGEALKAGQLESEACQPWIGRWRRLMGQVMEAKDLPRALRLELLNFLAIPLQGSDLERQILEEVVDAEIEFGLGTPLDRWMLFQRLGERSSLPAELAQALRSRMLRGIYIRQAHPVRIGQMRDPWTVFEISRSNTLLDRLLESFIVELGQQRTILSPVPLVELVPRLWREVHRAANLREIPVTLASDIPGREEPDFDQRLMVGIATDPAADVLRVHTLRRPRMDGLVDGMALESASAVRDRLRRGPATMLGIVAAREGSKGWLNLGLAEPVPVELDGSEGHVGELIAVPVHETAVGPGVDRMSTLSRPASEPEVGDLREATVLVRQVSGVSRVSITIENGPQFDLDDDQPARLRRLWLPDITSLLTGELPRESMAFARWNGMHWLPADQGVTEFLTAATAKYGEADSFPLVVAGGLVSSEEARYSAAPGLNVIIPHAAWSGPDRQRLTRKLQALGGDATGLRINVRISAPSDGKAFLVLAENAFDERAQDWSHVFGNGEDYEAWLDGTTGQFQFGTGIRSFPPVTVDVPSTVDGSACRFTPRSWTDAQQRAARVEGMPEERKELSLGEPSADNLRFLLEIGKDTELTLDHALSTPRFGVLTGWTTNGLKVSVEAESLHFGALGEDSKIPFPLIRGRRLDVTYVKPRAAEGTPRRVDGAWPADLLRGLSPSDQAPAEDFLVRSQLLRGIVVGLPPSDDRNRDDALYTVWLDLGLGERAAVCSLRRRDFEHPPTAPAALIEGRVSAAGGWAFTATTRIIRARARWNLHEGRPSSIRDCLFLGVVPWHGDRCHLIQSSRKPVLYVYDAAEDRPQPHLSAGHGRGPSNQAGQAQAPEYWTDPAAALQEGRVEITRIPAERGSRVVVHLGTGREAQLLVGQIRQRSSDPDPSPERVDMELKQLPRGRAGDGASEVSAYRVFVLSSRLAPAAATEPQLIGDEVDGYKKYLASERAPLDADLVEVGGTEQVRLLTPWTIPDGDARTRDLALAIGEEPWVDTDKYSRKGIRVILQEQNGRPVASYRHVPVLGLPAAVSFLRRQGLVVGARSALRQPLRYVDRRELPQGIVHRFEWGLGFTLCVADDQLTVGGCASENWPLTPFHGDTVTEVLICTDPRADGEFTMDFAPSAVQQGWYGDLLRDADGDIITTAEIEADENGNSPRITSIYVRWRRDLRQQGLSYRDGQQIRPSRLRLSDPAVRQITAAWTPTDGPQRAFVQLQRERFRKSGGRDAQFDFIWPTLDARPEWSGREPDDRRGLPQGKLAFLVAGDIRQLPNDLKLVLRPEEMLGSGAEGSFSVSVLRRDFSWRQDLLRQIYEGDDPANPRADALKGDLYLVKLKRVRHQTLQAEGQINDRLPRPRRVLRSYVASSDMPCFAVAQLRSNDIWLEIRPNVIFKLEPQDVELRGEISSGTVVRVTGDRSDALTLWPALIGDHAYVPPAGRPALLLPMQNLLRFAETLDQALKGGTYTVAGLPAVTVPAAPRERAPGAQISFAKKLITTRHPKIALISTAPGQAGRAARYRMAAPDQTVRAGTLSIDSAGTAQVSALGESARHRIPWAFVSFLDAGQREIRQRCIQRWWQYHDLTTSYRHPKPPHQPQPAVSLPRATITGEPVFFSANWSLRHPAQDLERFGFPATELVDGAFGRQSSGRPNAFPVAAVSRRGGQVTGIWVEVAPGRLVELAGSMLTTDDPGQLSLAGLAWPHFAAGDIVALTVHRSHRLEIGAISLHKWRPGPRGGFGRRVLLPVRRLDAETMAATLGAGEWTLQYPLEPDRAFPRAGEAVWLTAANEITSAETVRNELRPGDAVLVGLASDRLVVLGAEAVQPEIVRASRRGWVCDVLDGPARSALLGMCGGALPCTVEWITGDRVGLSRRKQDDALPEGQFVPGKPLGLLQDSVVFRAGVRLYKCALATLIPDLPTEHGASALEVLGHIPETLWLTGTTRDGLAIGLPDEHGRFPQKKESRVQLLAAFDGTVNGVLCWESDARRPRWLPAADCGWFTPTFSQLADWVGMSQDASPRRGVPAGQRREVSVAVRPGGGVSVVDTAVNRQRLEQLQVGDPLRVDVLDARGTPITAADADVLDASSQPERLSYLARIYLSDLFVELQISADATAPMVGRPRFCEVEYRSAKAHRPTVRVCDSGARRMSMALPAWVCNPQKGRLEPPERLVRYMAPGPGPVPAHPGLDTDEAIVQAALRLTASGVSHEPNGPAHEESWSAARAWLAEHGGRLLGTNPGLVLDLVPGLAATVVLAQLGQSGGLAAESAALAAVHAGRQLGLRAAASRHLEPLVNLWLMDPRWEERSNLWLRLEHVVLSPTTSTSAVDDIRRVDDAIRARVALRPNADLALVSSCLAASVGIHVLYDDIDAYPGLLRDVNAFGRALTPRRNELAAQARFVDAQVSMVIHFLHRALGTSPLTLLPVPEQVQDHSCRAAAGLLTELQAAGTDEHLERAHDRAPDHA